MTWELPQPPTTKTITTVASHRLRAEALAYGSDKTTGKRPKGTARGYSFGPLIGTEAAKILVTQTPCRHSGSLTGPEERGNETQRHARARYVESGDGSSTAAFLAPLVGIVATESVILTN